MPNKAWKKLNEIDQLIRRAKPPGMDDGTHVTIEYFTGFELFNTRPYHNFDTWSGGYRVQGLGVTVRSEDLDDAVRQWSHQVEAMKQKSVEAA